MRVKLNNFIINSVLFYIISNYIFFSTLKINDLYQTRFLIFLLLLQLPIFIFDDLRLKKYLKLKLFLVISVFVSAHFYINSIYINETVTLKQHLTVIALSLISLISFYYKDLIIKKFDQILLIFFAIFFSSSIINLLYYQPDSPTFCGGLPNIFGQFIVPEIHDLKGEFVSKYKLSYKEFLFKENSHIGMIAPSIIIYLIFNYKKTSKLFFYSTLIFIILTFIKSSTTLHLGLIISLIPFVIFFRSKLDKKGFLVSILLIFYSSFNLLFDEECRNRIGIHDNSKIFNYVKILNQSFFYQTKINETETDDYSESFFTSDSSTSTIVFFNSFTIMKKSLLDKPLGWGLNRYENAFFKYNQTKGKFKKYNVKDASNNFVKIIVELGIFGLVFYYYVFYFFFSRNISVREKSILIPFILIQSVRGAGYFNGGFILIFFLILLIIYEKTKS